MDETEIGEFAYDYVELSRDVVNGLEHEAVPASRDSPSPEDDLKEPAEK